MLLHKLGTDTWQKREEKPRKFMMSQLSFLESYAKRKSKPGLAMELNETEYAQFMSTFI